MKKFILSITLVAIAIASSKYEDIDKIFEDTKGNLESSILTDIENLENPFLLPKSGDKNALNSNYLIETNETRYSLQAIFNSKRAKVNGKWYKKDSNISGVKIIKITKDSIELDNNVTLTINSNFKSVIRRVDAKESN
jgi:hypothetical protein